MFYDFHIHSCLSPCSNDDMTPNNIVNMALIKGLDMIAVCDHNSTKQQKAIHAVAEKNGLKIMYGVEIQTIEEVHICCYFKDLLDVNNFQDWIDIKLPTIKNDSNYFGNEWVMDESDQIINSEQILLLSSVNATLDECIDKVHDCNGKAVLAHVIDRVNSVTHQLGFIPENCKFDGLEIKNLEQMFEVKKRHPWICETTWFINSDAHQLNDIHEAEYSLSSEEFNHFWESDCK